MLLVRKVLSDKGELKLQGAEGARPQPREARARANHPTKLPIRTDFTCLERLYEGGKTIGGGGDNGRIGSVDIKCRLFSKDICQHII